MADIVANILTSILADKKNSKDVVNKVGKVSLIANDKSSDNKSDK